MANYISIIPDGETVDALLTTVQNSNLSATHKITRSATIVVAASDSSEKSKAQADYVCDGTADNVEIQAAIDALPLTGGRVLLLDGTFNIVTGINPISNSTLEGQGFSTILKLANSTNSNIIEGTSLNNVFLRNIQIDGNKANNTYQGDDNNQNGILVDEWYNSIIENVLVQNCAASGVRVKANSGASSSKLMYNQFSKLSSHFNNVDGISIDTWAEYITVSDSMFCNNTMHGIHTASANITFANCHSVKNSECGVYVDSSAKTSNNLFLGCHINHNTKHGMLVDGSQYTTVNGCKIIANGYTGVFINGGAYNSVTSNHITTNSYNNPNMYDNVRLGSTASKCTVSNNTILQLSGGGRYGINEASTASNNIITGNFLSEHTTAHVSVLGAGTIIKDNQGYANEKTGTATITKGQTTVDVTHGLAAAPTRVILTPTTATAGKDFYVSAKADTTFTITIDSAAEADISFDWHAVI